MTQEELVETVHKEIMEYFIEPLNGHRGLARAVVNIVLEEAAKAANVFPKGSAHTYSSENADLYHAQEYTCVLAVERILALKSEPPK